MKMKRSGSYRIHNPSNAIVAWRAAPSDGPRAADPSNLAAPKGKRGKRGKRANLAAWSAKRRGKAVAKSASPRRAAKRVSAAKRLARMRVAMFTAKPRFKTKSTMGTVVGKRPKRVWKSTKDAAKGGQRKFWKLKTAAVTRTWKRGKRIHRETALFIPNPLAGNMTELVAMGLSAVFGAIISQNVDGMVAVRGSDNHPDKFTGEDGAILVAAKPDAARLIAQGVLFGVSAVGSGFAKKKGYNNVAAVLGGVALGTLINNALDLFHKLAVPAMPDSMRGAYPGMTTANQDNVDAKAEALRSGPAAKPAAPPATPPAGGVVKGFPQNIRSTIAGLPTPQARMTRTPAPAPSVKTNPFTN